MKRMKLLFAGVTVVIRGCAGTSAGGDECADVTASSIKTRACVCTTDYCNGTSAGGDECADVTASSIKTRACVCTTDYCNDGQLVKPTLYKVIICVAMATVTAVAWMNQV